MRLYINFSSGFDSNRRRVYNEEVIATQILLKNDAEEKRWRNHSHDDFAGATKARLPLGEGHGTGERRKHLQTISTIPHHVRAGRWMDRAVFSMGRLIDRMKVTTWNSALWASASRDPENYKIRYESLKNVGNATEFGTTWIDVAPTLSIGAGSLNLIVAILLNSLLGCVCPYGERLRLRRCKVGHVNEGNGEASILDEEKRGRSTDRDGVGCVRGPQHDRK